MRVGQHVEDERAVHREPSRRSQPPAPAPLADLLALQHDAGNRAVCSLLARSAPRTLSRLRVTNIDYDPKTQHFHHSDIVVADFLTLINNSKFYDDLRTNERRNLSTIGTAVVQAQDIPHLAEAVVDHVVLPAAPSADHTDRVQALLQSHRPAVEGALAKAAPKEASPKEEGVFERVLHVASLKSRAKQVASEVQLTKLEDTMQNYLNGLAVMLNSKHDELGALQTYLDEPGAAPRDRVGLPLMRETPHENQAGWLPPVVSVNPAPTLNQQTVTWVTNITNTAGDRHRPEVVRVFPVPGAATAALVESSDLDDEVKQRWVRQVFRPVVASRADRSRLAWKRFADPGFANCPYIEFAATGAGGLSRTVFDFVNDVVYINVHYNWVGGFNPFFKVLGMPQTL
jgi:hypothetical protein